MTPLLDLAGHWFGVPDGDARAIALYSRHYSAKKRGLWRCGIGGPGERLILLTLDCAALWVWRKRQEGAPKGDAYGYDDGQRGVMCSVFRNEGPILSSLLVREACEIAQRKWPGARLFTYVEDGKIRSSNPGACFKKAGWRRCAERNKDGRLTILELLPVASAVAVSA